MEVGRLEESLFLPLLEVGMGRDRSSCRLNVEVLSPGVYQQVKLGFELLDLPAAALGSRGVWRCEF